MGHKKSLVRQVFEKLQGMAAFGQSKHRDKLSNGGKAMPNKIYSHSTMKNYLDAATTFARWAREQHSCKTLEQAQLYTGDYLRYRMSGGNTCWTVSRDASALAKLYQCKSTDFGVKLPKRRRADVRKNRDSSNAKGFNAKKHSDLVDLCKATGLRRHEVAALRPEDVVRDGQGRVLVYVQQGKGGKERTVVALNDRPYQIARTAQSEGRERVIERIPCRAPIHPLRHEFARELYHRLARDTALLPKAEVYCCRADRAGIHYDKAAMRVVSEALGHNRLDVVTNYLR